MCSIDRIFEMLYRDNDEETQRLGIEEAKKIKYLSVFIQPVESEAIWENCAKVLADKCDAELSPYLPRLLEWIKLLCLPGAQLIYDRLTEVSKKDMEFPLSICLSLAEQRGDKFHIDLKEINRLWLLRAGIDPARIDVHPDCTKCHPERYWSHRAMGEKRGGMAAMICLTEDML